MRIDPQHPHMWDSNSLPQRWLPMIRYSNDAVTSVSVKVCCIFMEDSFKIKDKFFKLFCSVCPLYLCFTKMILKV